jgi:hypothetical protein
MIPTEIEYEYPDGRRERKKRDRGTYPLYTFFQREH